MKKLKSFGLLLFVAAFFIFGCGAGTSQSSLPSLKKLSIAFTQDNSYSTYLQCQYGAQGIDCTGQPQTVPTFGSLSGLIDLDQNALLKIAASTDGCYADIPTGEPSILLTEIETNVCRFNFKLYSGEAATGIPVTSWSYASGSPFSTLFPYLKKYTFGISNLAPESSCTKNYLYQARPSYSQITKSFSLSNSSVTFSSLFSLQMSPSMTNGAVISKNTDFNVSYIPAINSAALISAGATDQTISSYLTPHLGDFILLTISDSHGNKSYCKQADAISGTVRVPSAILSKFYDSTGFVFTRYKIIRKDISDNAEIVVTMKVNQYTTGTDAYGQVNGKLSVYIQ